MFDMAHAYGESVTQPINDQHWYTWQHRSRTAFGPAQSFAYESSIVILSGVRQHCHLHINAVNCYAVICGMLLSSLAQYIESNSDSIWLPSWLVSLLHQNMTTDGQQKKHT